MSQKLVTLKDSDSEWIGKKAPAFSLPDQTGATRSLADAKGRWLVLFFYPKDDTPHCTNQACGFRDRSAEFEAIGATVWGISILDADSKAKFAEKFSLNYPLLADENHKVALKYGVWREKNLYGHKYMGVVRETFVVDPKGKIAAHWPRATGNDKHSQDVLAWLKKNMPAK